MMRQFVAELGRYRAGIRTQRTADIDTSPTLAKACIDMIVFQEIGILDWSRHRMNAIGHAPVVVWSQNRLIERYPQEVAAASSNSRGFSDEIFEVNPMIAVRRNR